MQLFVVGLGNKMKNMKAVVFYESNYFLLDRCVSIMQSICHRFVLKEGLYLFIFCLKHHQLKILIHHAHSGCVRPFNVSLCDLNSAGESIGRARCSGIDNDLDLVVLCWLFVNRIFPDQRCIRTDRCLRGQTVTLPLFH